jgi:hypothetical protein
MMAGVVSAPRRECPRRERRGASARVEITAITGGVRRALVALAVVAALVAGRHGIAPAAASPHLVPAAHAGRITVLAEPGLERVAQQLADSAEAELGRIAADLIDLPVPHAIEVHLIREASELAEVAPEGRGAPPWAIGVAYPDLGVISVAMRRGAQLADPATTLRHELAHIALGAALGARAPHWLHEGFAYQHSGEWSWERTETLAGMAWAHSIIELDDLDRTFPQDEQPANRAYAESYDFVGYLSRRGRWEDPSDDGDRWPFRRFLRDLGQGSSMDAAAIHAFGRPIHALFDEWRGDLGSRYFLAPIGVLGMLLWILCAMLLAAAWWRRRRQNRRRIAQWDLEERLHREAEPPAQVIAPPYVAWPGEDPLAAEPDDDEPRPAGDPRWMN